MTGGNDVSLCRRPLLQGALASAFLPRLARAADYPARPVRVIVAYAPGDATLLVPGATVLVQALQQPDGSLTATRVNAEKDGVKPPM